MSPEYFLRRDGTVFVVVGGIGVTLRTSQTQPKLGDYRAIANIDFEDTIKIYHSDAIAILNSKE